MPDAISTVAMDDNASHANYNSIDDDDVKLAVDSGSTHSHDSFRNESSPSPPMKVWLKVLDIVTQMFMCGNRNGQPSLNDFLRLILILILCPLAPSLPFLCRQGISRS